MSEVVKHRVVTVGVGSLNVVSGKLDSVTESLYLCIVSELVAIVVSAVSYRNTAVTYEGTVNVDLNNVVCDITNKCKVCPSVGLGNVIAYENFIREGISACVGFTSHNHADVKAWEHVAVGSNVKVDDVVSLSALTDNGKGSARRGVNGDSKVVVGRVLLIGISVSISYNVGVVCVTLSYA